MKSKGDFLKLSNADKASMCKAVIKGEAKFTSENNKVIYSKNKETK